MTTGDGLSVWLYDQKMARLHEDRRHRLRLDYLPEAREAFDAGTPLLSLRLPLASTHYTDTAVRPFLEGLLPEGAPRQAIAEMFNLRPGDTYGFLRAIGRDCAGAVVVLPEDDPGPPPTTTSHARPVADEDLASLVRKLRAAPLGVSEHMRLSLAGLQEKLLLTRLPDGRWGLPVDGTPSTHIWKPPVGQLPGLVQNEAFCLRVAALVGLPTAMAEIVVVDGQPILSVERFDRRAEGDGTIKRLHQEDFCQATGVLPRHKYQEDGGPTLRTMAGLIKQFDRGSLSVLLQALVVNVALGNGDAHAKNFAILHDPSGVVRLAPLYDIVSTWGLNERLAMTVDGVHRLGRVSTSRLVREAVAWGMPEREATALVHTTLDQLPGSIAQAADEIKGVPTDLMSAVRWQVNRLQLATAPGSQ